MGATGGCMRANGVCWGIGSQIRATGQLKSSGDCLGAS